MNAEWHTKNRNRNEIRPNCRTLTIAIITCWIDVWSVENERNGMGNGKNNQVSLVNNWRFNQFPFTQSGGVSQKWAERVQTRWKKRENDKKRNRWAHRVMAENLLTPEVTYFHIIITDAFAIGKKGRKRQTHCFNKERESKRERKGERRGGEIARIMGQWKSHINEAVTLTADPQHSTNAK